ncbi:antitoxin [Saccharothrix xinjiangensis]|uniref:Antitoxin n=1 Tax=Saccharothrix xinjiangensis TaxID=204798 RepID=A0ABV9XYU3_9PSEU
MNFDEIKGKASGLPGRDRVEAAAGVGRAAGFAADRSGHQAQAEPAEDILPGGQ